MNRLTVSPLKLNWMDKYILITVAPGGTLGFGFGIYQGLKEERHNPDLIRTTLTTTFYGCFGLMMGSVGGFMMPMLVPVGIASYWSKKFM
jgi:hypothetical protein